MRDLLPHAAWREARTWGWPFQAGVAGLLAAAAVSLVVVPRLQREAATIATEADHATRQASRATATFAQSGQVPSDRFTSAFPVADARQARVAALLEAAVRHSLTLQRSEFQLGRDQPTGLLRYSVTMPVAGSYAQVRSFIEDALGADSALSLDKLRLRRTTPGAAIVEADLGWSFYMRSDNGVASRPAR